MHENGVLVADYAYDPNGNILRSRQAPSATPTEGGESTPTATGSITETPTPTPTPSETPTATGTTSASPTPTDTPQVPPFARGGRAILQAAYTSENCFQAATVEDPDGTLHQYHYTCAADGSLATKTDVLTGAVTTYSYDSCGNLRHVGLPDGRAIQYAIDPANRRVGKSICQGETCTRTESFLYLGIAPVAELDAQGEVRRTFVYGTKSNVPDYIEEASGARYRILSDHLGSVRLVVDATTGAIQQRIDYDELGTVTDDSNPGFQPFAYAGGLYDTDTHLVRFGARDFDAETGRWTSRDPIGFGGGDGNLYAYAGSEPVNRIDPAGLDWVDDLSNFSAGFGDTVSLGGTYYAREWLGANRVVDTNSGSYSAGGWAGTAHSLAAGGAGVLRNALSVGGRSGSLLTRIGRGASRLYKDRRQFATVSRQYWKANGGAGGKHLHHWFKPQRAGGSSAGWNLLELPGQFNSWMGYHAAGRGVEAGLRVAVPGSLAAGAAQGVNWGFDRAEWQAASE